MFIPNDQGEKTMLIDLRFILFENTICIEGLDRSVQRLAIKFREQKLQLRHTFRTIFLINQQKDTQTISIQFATNFQAIYFLSILQDLQALGQSEENPYICQGLTV